MYNLYPFTKTHPMNTKKIFLSALIVLLFSRVSIAQVGIGTNTPAASAQLDVASTERGFLPPRMTAAQRDLIASPATGLLIFQTDNTAGYYYYNGTAWVALGTGPTGPQGPIGLTGATGPAGSNAQVSGFTHYIGEFFNGGIIYYLYKGSDGLEHGLIVSTSQSTGAWQIGSVFINANRSEDGVFNTALLINSNSPAANYVTSLGTGWYLPSIDELALLYNNRYLVQKALREGGFTLLSNTAGNSSMPNAYWSSTENSLYGAWYFYFLDGYASSGSNKGHNAFVRGIKSF